MTQPCSTLLRPSPATFGVMLIVARITRTANENAKMKEHEFTLVLTADPNDEESDRMYGIFDDGTISTIAGVPQIRFHREARSLEEAIRSVIGDVRAAGLDVARVEMLPDALPT